MGTATQTQYPSKATPWARLKNRMASLQIASRGYSVAFVHQPPEEIETECLICHDIPFQPKMVTCCCVSFCATCIGRVERNGKPCPHCRGEFTSYDNKKLKRTLNSYKVYCPHKDKGCKWVGELGQCDDHLNQNASPDNLQRGCQFQEINCNRCQAQYERQFMSDHVLKQCPHRDVKCKYHFLGCELKRPQNGMEVHMREALESHLFLLAKSISVNSDDLKHELSELKKEQLKQQQEQLAELQRQHGQLERKYWMLFVTVGLVLVANLVLAFIVYGSINVSTTAKFDSVTCCLNLRDVCNSQGVEGRTVAVTNNETDWTDNSTSDLQQQISDLLHTLIRRTYSNKKTVLESNSHVEMKTNTSSVGTRTLPVLEVNSCTGSGTDSLPNLEVDLHVNKVRDTHTDWKEDSYSSEPKDNLHVERDCNASKVKYSHTNFRFCKMKDYYSDLEEDHHASHKVKDYSTDMEKHSHASKLKDYCNSANPGNDSYTCKVNYSYTDLEKKFHVRLCKVEDHHTDHEEDSRGSKVKNFHTQSDQKRDFLRVSQVKDLDSHPDQKSASPTSKVRGSIADQKKYLSASKDLDSHTGQKKVPLTSKVKVSRRIGHEHDDQNGSESQIWLKTVIVVMCCLCCCQVFDSRYVRRHRWIRMRNEKNRKKRLGNEYSYATY